MASDSAWDGRTEDDADDQDLNDLTFGADGGDGDDEDFGYFEPVSMHAIELVGLTLRNFFLTALNIRLHWELTSCSWSYAAS